MRSEPISLLSLLGLVRTLFSGSSGQEQTSSLIQNKRRRVVTREIRAFFIRDFGALPQEAAVQLWEKAALSYSYDGMARAGFT
jgi:hypothetical protein